MVGAALTVAEAFKLGASIFGDLLRGDAEASMKRVWRMDFPLDAV